MLRIMPLKLFFHVHRVVKLEKFFRIKQPLMQKPPIQFTLKHEKFSTNGSVTNFDQKPVSTIVTKKTSFKPMFDRSNKLAILVSTKMIHQNFFVNQKIYLNPMIQVFTTKHTMNLIQSKIFFMVCVHSKCFDFI